MISKKTKNPRKKSPQLTHDLPSGAYPTFTSEKCILKTFCIDPVYRCKLYLTMTKKLISLTLIGEIPYISWSANLEVDL